MSIYFLNGFKKYLRARNVIHQETVWSYCNNVLVLEKFSKTTKKYIYNWRLKKLNDLILLELTKIKHLVVKFLQCKLKPLKLYVFEICASKINQRSNGIYLDYLFEDNIKIVK